MTTSGKWIDDLVKSKVVFPFVLNGDRWPYGGSIIPIDILKKVAIGGSDKNLFMFNAELVKVTRGGR